MGDFGGALNLKRMRITADENHAGGGSALAFHTAAE
jgi:hypothetical protein